MRSRSFRVEPDRYSRRKHPARDRRFSPFQALQMGSPARSRRRTTRLPDATIFQWAQQHNAIVITFDEDFADTRMYPAGTHAGVTPLSVANHCRADRSRPRSPIQLNRRRPTPRQSDYHRRPANSHPASGTARLGLSATFRRERSRLLSPFPGLCSVAL